MYYAPMMIVRYWMVGPSRKYVEESQKGHERVVEGWRRAVEAAEKAQEGGYWAVHLNGESVLLKNIILKLIHRFSSHLFLNRGWVHYCITSTGSGSNFRCSWWD